METTSKNDESCQELKNINYKNMLLNGGKIEEDNNKISSMDKLDQFLESNISTTNADSWSKLDKTNKNSKCLAFAEKYAVKNNLHEESKNNLINFLIEAVDKKKIQRVKDVTYDKITGEIKDIIGLQYNKATKKYTIKNMDKRVSILKSLPPKKTKKIKPQPSKEKQGDSA